MEGLKNMMEDNVEHTLNQLLPTMPNVCSCDDCKLDMATYALNRLQPKYARTAKGIVMHRFDTASSQVEAEILTAVVSAITIIGSHPHHPPLNTSNTEQGGTDNNVAPSEQTPATGNTAE